MTSEHDHATLAPEQATIPPGHSWNRIPLIAGAVAVLGAVGCAILGAANPKQFFFSWLVAFLFFMSLALGALGAVFGMLGLNRLPMHHHPLFKSKVFERASDDTFFISIESWDPRFDPSGTAALLKSLGARNVELLES